MYHYSILAMFMWSLAQAFYLFLCLVVVFVNSSVRIFVIITIAAWGACEFACEFRAEH